MFWQSFNICVRSKNKCSFCLVSGCSKYNLGLGNESWAPKFVAINKLAAVPSNVSVFTLTLVSCTNENTSPN